MSVRLVHAPACAPAACAPLIETMNQSNEQAGLGRDSNKHPAELLLVQRLAPR